MPGIFTLHFGFEGRLSNIPDTLIYSPGGGLISATIKTVVVCNTSGADVTINIYARKGGGGVSRRIWDKDYVLPAGQSRPLTFNKILNPGDSLRGDASVANVVDYAGDVVEET